jgi:aminopeptidase N
MRKQNVIFVVAFFCLTLNLNLKAQFTHEDTLRGSITKERAWWDLVHYDLKVNVDPKEKSFSGTNTVTYRVLKPASIMQIDLQTPMVISKVTQDGVSLDFTRDGNVWYIQVQKPQNINDINQLTITYGGKVHQAKNAPWDGGVVWSKDANGKDFIATACQGIGASIWYPCKDHTYDEPDSMRITITAPDHLFGVSNGRLRSVTQNNNKTKSFVWVVVNPINNYGVNLSVGDYVHFGEVYPGEKGPLECNYYALSYNLDKAKKQFKEVDRMLKAFEYWFGPYPFYEDGYKLVEVPYLGMEHQSSVTYGNRYANGYLGTDLSGTGWGLKFDFIIIHESGHEWFGNNITHVDVADMWIHESFTSYSENLFVDYYYGSKASAEYTIGTRKNIRNDRPIIGTYNVNSSGSGDMYYKGANMLLMLRTIVHDDVKWREMLRGMNQKFYHQVVATKDIEGYMADVLGLILDGFFDQYLRTTQIPTFNAIVKNNVLKYRWENCVPNFSIPLEIEINNKKYVVQPSIDWQTLKVNKSIGKIELSDSYYCKKIIKGIDKYIPKLKIADEVNK